MFGVRAGVVAADGMLMGDNSSAMFRTLYLHCELALSLDPETPAWWLSEGDSSSASVAVVDSLLRGMREPRRAPLGVAVSDGDGG